MFLYLILSLIFLFFFFFAVFQTMHALLGYFRTTTGTMQNIRKAVAAVTRSLLLHQRYSTNRNIPPVFKVITNNVDVKSSSFEANTTFNCELEEKYNVFLKMISAGGGEKAIERHTVVSF